MCGKDNTLPSQRFTLEGALVRVPFFCQAAKPAKNNWLTILLANNANSLAINFLSKKASVRFLSSSSVLTLKNS